MSLGIYIHVPFCLRKCPYCDFYSVKYDEYMMSKYVDAVCRNIERYKGHGITADTVYFGGGTPSLLAPFQVQRILDSINKSFKLGSPEITLEANPCSVDSEKLKGYNNAGINRISFGVQSADNKQLGFLGRLHNFESAKEAVYNAQKSGFDNISCDIMLGLAGQDMDSLCCTIEEIAALPVNHISSYMLKIEKGTAFDNESVKNTVADEDLQCDMYLKTVELLESRGFEQYEISNFAKDGKYSRHNLKYWQGEDYIGIGPASHSFFKGKRFCVPKNLEKFISDPIQNEIITENNPDKLEEYIVFSLRLKWGIDFGKLCELGGKDFAQRAFQKANYLAKAKLCNLSENKISLTPQGFLVSNSIICDLLES